MPTNKGFIGLGALLAIIIVVAIIGGGAYYASHSQSHATVQSEITASTTEQKPAAQATTSTSSTVPGMHEYIDSEFGFSFWYPAGFTVSDKTPKDTNFRSQFIRPSQKLVKLLIVHSSDRDIYIEEVNSPERYFDISPGTCGYCGPLSYYFDTKLHTWMKVYPEGANGAPDFTQAQIEQSKLPKPADISVNSMGGLHEFSTEQRESAVIIPLSAQHFVFVEDVTYSQACGSACASDVKGGAKYLADTIVATDPSVATPVSISEQKKVIEAEYNAYIGS